MSEKRTYDSTVARIAGNIASGIAADYVLPMSGKLREIIAEESVALARTIVAEVERTEAAPMMMTAQLCTCQVVSGGFRATNTNCPTHGNIQSSYTLPPAGHSIDGR